MKVYIIIEDKELLISSWSISKILDIPHRLIIRIINKHKKFFESLSESKFVRYDTIGTNRGAHPKEYFLNEEQLFFSVSELMNSKKFVRFKAILCRHMINYFRSLSRNLMLYQTPQKTTPP